MWIFQVPLSVNYNKTYSHSSVHIDCYLGEQAFRENIHSPRQVAHEECSRRLRVNFKIFSNLLFSILILNLWWVVFSFQTQLMFSNLGLQIFYKKYSWIVSNKCVLRRRNDIYRARKQRGIAMAAYLTKYRGTQYRRLNTLHCFKIWWNLVEIFSGHLLLWKRKRIGRYLRHSAIKSK